MTMVNTIKISEMTDGGDLEPNQRTAGLEAGENVTFSNPFPLLPPGNTGDRPPAAPSMYFRLRYNTEIFAYEYYDASTGNWVQLSESDGVLTATGTENQVYVNGTFGVPQEGPITLTTPQDINTNSNVTFNSLQLANPLEMAYGGTSSALTPSNGGIVYSSATQLRILSGTPVAQRLLLSRANSTPQWSITTYPLTNAINTIMYASAANALDVITPVNSGVMISDPSGVPQMSASMTNGQLIIGSTGAPPQAANLTAGSGISITNTAGGITIANTGSSGWVFQTTSSVTMSVNTGYTSAAGVSLVTFTLPTSALIGDWIEINGRSSGLYTLAQAAGQQIKFGNISSTAGAGGSVSSTNDNDCIRLRCSAIPGVWTVVSSIGNFTIV